MSASNIETILTVSPEETEEVGMRLASMLGPGAVLALYGDLAAGKTCLVRGLARHYGAGHEVSSPTFTLINEYPTAPKIFHFDLYRLSGPEELADLGLEEMIDIGICAIEWAERAGEMLPKRRVTIRFAHAGQDQRKIEIENAGLLPDEWAERLGATSRG